MILLGTLELETFGSHDAASRMVFGDDSLTAPRGLLAEDANAVAHLIVQNGAFFDSKSNSWVGGAGLTDHPSAPLMFASGVEAEGLSGFADATVLTSPLPADVLDFTGDFILTFIVRTGADIQTVPNGLMPTVYANGTTGVGTGAVLLTSPWTPIRKFMFSGVPGYLYSTVVLAPDTDYIVSIGRGGGNAWIKVNAEAPVSSLSSYAAARLDYAARIGGYNDIHAAVMPYWSGRIYEVLATTTPASAAVLDAIHAQVLG